MIRRSLFLFALAVPSLAQTRYHVDASAPPGGDGLSWSTAMSSIDDALGVARAGNHVWVATGRYQPTVRRDAADPRSASFAPAAGVRLFGGFRGDEVVLADRAGLYRSTVLDGDLGVAGDVTDNAYNVVRLEGNGARHVLDGFTVRGGNADSTGLARGGGAVSSQLGRKTIRNCVFESNRGRIGGALLSQISIMSVHRCTFRDNAADTIGGAIWATGSFGVTDSRFYRNQAGGRGGAVYANQGQLDNEQVPVTRFQNSVFHDNVAQRGGAAFVGDPSGPVAAGKVIWSGCTFYANAALQAGGAIGTEDTMSPGTLVDVVDSIVWGNRAGDLSSFSGVPGHFRDVQYSIVQGGWPGPGNLDLDPRFRAAHLRDLRLGAGSPAVDAGHNELVLRDFNDLDGDGDVLERTPLDALTEPRRLDDPLVQDTGTGSVPLTDMGAYERRE